LREIEETLALRVAEREEAARKLARSRSAAIKGLAQIGQRVPDDASVEELERALLDAFDGRAVEAARAEIERELSESAKAWESARKALSVLEVSVATVDAQITDRRGAHGRLHTRTETAGVALKEALDELGLSNAGELKTRVLSSTDRDLLQRNVDDIRGQFEQATGRADALAQQLTEHRELQPDGFVEGQAFETLETENREAAAALETHRQEVARVAAQQEEQERTRSRRAELIETLEEAEKEASLWNEMRLLIGSNDGGAFQRFAQTLNLSELVDRANVRLRELEPRYELVVATDSSGNPELAFAVRDHEHGGRERPQTTLSGGETFLVSLALALALSEYRQTQMPIETLLLDEGFGTLDPETLDIAMSALERLCATGGTQIGVISHVEGLRDRINAQIVVEKLGGGRSRLRATR
jgi:exonuclease SbcC